MNQELNFNQLCNVKVIMLNRSVPPIVCKGINFMQMKQLFFTAFLLRALTMNAQQKDCHLHTVQPGEGIYSLSRLYSTKPAHIMGANPDIGKEMQIKVGQKICIPKSISVIPTEQLLEANKIAQNEKLYPAKATAAAGSLTKQGDLWIHTVHKSETFYGICKLYQVLAYDMIFINNLPNTIIAENQKLILPPTAVIPNQVSNANQAPVEVSPLVEMTKTAAVEAKKGGAKPVEKKDVVEKKISKADSKKKEEKPAEVEEQPTEVAKAKPETKSADDAKVKTHTVQKGDTYFSLTKKYGLEIVDIKNLNQLTSTDLKLGQTIIVSKPEVAAKEEEGIPANAVVIDISKEVAKREAEKAAQAAALEAKNIKKKASAAAKEKTSQAKEEQAKAKAQKEIVKEEPKATIEALAAEVKQPEPIAEAKVEEVKKAEPVVEAKVEDVKQPEPIVEAKVEDVKPVDVIANEVPKPATVLTAKPVLSFSEEYGNSFNNFSSNNNYRLQRSRGVAAYTESITGNEYLVFYNDAEPGSIVKVTNLMSKQSAYVKVMGGISTADNSGNVSIKVSKKLAQQLQVLDDMFLVEVSRYTKN